MKAADAARAAGEPVDPAVDVESVLPPLLAAVNTLLAACEAKSGCSAGCYLGTSLDTAVGTEAFDFSYRPCKSGDYHIAYSHNGAQVKGAALRAAGWRFDVLPYRSNNGSNLDDLEFKLQESLRTRPGTCWKVNGAGGQHLCKVGAPAVIYLTYGPALASWKFTSQAVRQWVGPPLRTLGPAGAAGPSREVAGAARAFPPPKRPATLGELWQKIKK